MEVHGRRRHWSLISADEELGYVYVAAQRATNDWYGGERPGDNLFADTLVCLDAKTGKRVWHYPDGPPRPVGLRLPPRRSSPTSPSAAAASRRSCRSPSRLHVSSSIASTGKPVGRSKSVPCRSRPCPASVARRRSRSRPSPRRSIGKAFTVDDLIDFTPALRAEAVEIAKTLVLGSDVHTADGQQHGTRRRREGTA